MIKTREDGYSDTYFSEGEMYELMQKGEEARINKLKNKDDKKNKTPDEQV